MPLVIGRAGGGWDEGPTGGPRSAAPATMRPLQDYADRGVPPVPEPDKLAEINPKDEWDFLRRGGRTTLEYADGLNMSADRATFVDGAFFDPAIGARTTSGGVAVIPLQGLIRPEKFTFRFKARHPTLAGSAAVGQLYSVGPFGQHDGFAVYKSTNTSITVRFYANDVPSAEITISGLTSGDWPVGQWRAITVTVDGTTATIRLGNNSKSATGTITALRSWAFAGGVICAQSDLNGGGTSPFEVTFPEIFNSARVPGTTEMAYEAPAVTVDCAAFEDDVDFGLALGVMGQYPYWRDTQADGTGGSTAIRDALIALEAAVGFDLVRIDHFMDKISGTDHSLLTGPMDVLHAAGFRFWLTTGYNSSATGGQYDPPNNNATYVQKVSDAVTFMRGRGYEVVLLSPWNEPSGDNFWTGTDGAYSTMVAAWHTKMAADHPGIPTINSDEHFFATEATPTRQVIADGVPVDALGSHAGYLASDWEMRDTHARMRAYAASHGHASNMDIWMGEWNPDLGAMGLWAGITTTTDVRVLRGHPIATVAHAAKCAQRVWHLIDDNVKGAIFTRMGILDSAYTSSEQLLGLATNDDPPRPLPVFAAFETLLKLKGGSRVQAESTHPAVKVLASVGDGVTTIVYAAYREWDPTELISFNLRITGLPSSYTWEQGRFDYQDAPDSLASDSRVRVVDSGGLNDPMPLGVTMTADGIGYLRILTA